jgi:hypothetical protein
MERDTGHNTILPIAPGGQGALVPQTGLRRRIFISSR